MLIGYMRVSKSGGSQTIDLQRDALIAAGVDPAQIYEDRASGQLDARPGLDATLKALRTGDTLVVWKLDRLGRNLRHLVNTVHDLTKQGVASKSSQGTVPPLIRPHQRASWSSAFSPRSPNSNAS
jgi:DNA invertase Pin-like site-specific DNA recombinase